MSLENKKNDNQGKNLTTLIICVIGSIVSFTFFCITIFLLIRSGYARDEGIYTSTAFSTALNLSMPVCIVAFAVLLIIGHISAKRQRRSVLLIVFLSCFVIFELFATVGWLVANNYSLKHDSLNSNYSTTISLAELEGIFLDESGDKEYIIYIGRRSCPECAYINQELTSFIEETQINILYYSTEQDRYSNSVGMEKVLKQINVVSVPTIIVVQGNEVVYQLEGLTCVKDLREVLSNTDS